MLADCLITIAALAGFALIAPHLDWVGGENMAVKDYWVYQKRNVPVPWALYIVKEYDRRKPVETIIDWTLYHEDIPTQTHSKTFSGLHFDTVSGYADAITAEMVDYVSITSQDHAQIENALYDILR